MILSSLRITPSESPLPQLCALQSSRKIRSKIGARMPTCVPTNYKVLRVRGNVKEGIFNPDLSQGARATFEDPAAFACTTPQHHAYRCLRQGLDHQAHVRPLPPLLLLHPRIMQTPQCAHVGQPVSAHAQSCVHRLCHARCIFTVLCSCAEKCGLAETEPDATSHNTLYYS